MRTTEKVLGIGATILALEGFCMPALPAGERETERVAEPTPATAQADRADLRRAARIVAILVGAGSAVVTNAIRNHIDEDSDEDDTGGE